MIQAGSGLEAAGRCISHSWRWKAVLLDMASQLPLAQLRSSATEGYGASKVIPASKLLRACSNYGNWKKHLEKFPNSSELIPKIRICFQWSDPPCEYRGELTQLFESMDKDGNGMYLGDRWTPGVAISGQ